MSHEENQEAKEIAKEESEIAKKEREPCPVTDWHCNYYSYEYDEKSVLVSSSCHHPENPESKNDGSCRFSLCPMI